MNNKFQELYAFLVDETKPHDDELPHLDWAKVDISNLDHIIFMKSRVDMTHFSEENFCYIEDADQRKLLQDLFSEMAEAKLTPIEVYLWVSNNGMSVIEDYAKVNDCLMAGIATTVWHELLEIVPDDLTDGIKHFLERLIEYARSNYIILGNTATLDWFEHKKTAFYDTLYPKSNLTDADLRAVIMHPYVDSLQIIKCDDSIERTLSFIEKASHIRSLYITGSNFTEEELSALALAVNSNTNISLLDISECELTKEDEKTLTDAIHTAVHLSSFHPVKQHANSLPSVKKDSSSEEQDISASDSDDGFNVPISGGGGLAKRNADFHKLMVQIGCSVGVGICVGSIIALISASAIGFVIASVLTAGACLALVRVYDIDVSIDIGAKIKGVISSLGSSASQSHAHQ